MILSLCSSVTKCERGFKNFIIEIESIIENIIMFLINNKMHIGSAHYDKHFVKRMK